MEKAGRKPIYDEAMTVTTIYLPVSMKRFVEERFGKLSKYVRTMIQHDMEDTKND